MPRGGFGGMRGGFGMPRRRGFPIMGGGPMMGGFGGMGMGMGSPLLTALLSGGLGYTLGSGMGQQRMSEEQSTRIGQLEQQQQQQPGAAPYPSYPQYPTAPAYPQSAPAPQPAAQTGVGPVGVSESDRLAQLRLLGQLHDAGVLTDDEFEREKLKVLHG